MVPCQALQSICTVALEKSRVKTSLPAEVSLHSCTAPMARRNPSYACGWAIEGRTARALAPWLPVALPLTRCSAALGDGGGAQERAQKRLLGWLVACGQGGRLATSK